MVIKKQYNIGQLAEQLQTEVEKSRKYNGAVKLDILTANDILFVLNETNRREQKHQTLVSALTLVEKEDDTQTNIMEEHKKPECFAECFGRYYTNCKQCDNVDCDVRIECISETNLREDKTKEQKTKHYGCFGKYVENDIECCMCMCGDKCLKEAKRRMSKTKKGKTNE